MLRDKKRGDRCVYVNRAFAYGIKNHKMVLWGKDNAHTNTHGAYLIVCTFYATLFGRSATELDNGYHIPEEDARLIRQIADKIALEGVMPWEEYTLIGRNQKNTKENKEGST